VTKAARVVAAGDTVRVASGLYAERVTLTTSGTAGNPIAVLGPSDRSATNYGFYLNGANYITVGWFSCSNNVIASTAYDWTDAGIASYGHNNQIISNDCYMNPIVGILSYPNGYPSQSSSNCVIQGNRCWSNVMAGLFINGNADTIVRWNEIWGTMMTNSKNAYVKGDADGIQCWGDNLLVESNYVHGLWVHTNGPNSNLGAHVDGLQTWVDSSGRNALRWSTVRGNIIDVPDTASCMMLQGCTNTAFYNNVFRAHRLVVDTAHGGVYPGKERYYNNTFIVKWNPELQAITGDPDALTTGYMIQLELTNNLFITDHSCQLIYNNGNTDISTNVLTGKNLFYYTEGNVPNCDSYTFAASDIKNLDPKLAGAFAATLDFRFASDSAAKDAGVPILKFSTDVYSTPRPQDSAWDIGAYQYVTGLPDLGVQSPAPPNQLRRINGP
jgi:hypothetical protein